MLNHSIPQDFGMIPSSATESDWLPRGSQSYIYAKEKLFNIQNNIIPSVNQQNKRKRILSLTDVVAQKMI